MKLILTAIFFFLAANAFSQFSLSSSVGYGVKVNSEFEYEIFQSSIQVTPQYQIDKFNIAIVGLSINDSSANVYGGLKTGYSVWKKDNKQLALSLSALQGTEGKTLLGGGLSYEVDNTFISADFYNENKFKNFIANLSFGIYILRN